MIRSEEIEPFFSMLIGRYGMTLVNQAKRYGCSSNEFQHTLAYWQYMKQGIEKAEKDLKVFQARKEKLAKEGFI